MWGLRGLTGIDAFVGSETSDGICGVLDGSEEDMTWHGELETLRDLALYSTLEDLLEAACSQRALCPYSCTANRTPAS